MNTIHRHGLRAHRLTGALRLVLMGGCIAAAAALLPAAANAQEETPSAENAKALRARFSDRSSEPVIAALIAACLFDAKHATVLLGQRTPTQVEAAYAAASLRIEFEELAWIRSLYFGVPA